MSCACRTKSLRIFVQSLTELSVTDSAVTRSVRLNHSASQFTFRQASARYPTRLFTSASVAYFPRHKWQENSHTLSAGKAEEESPHTAIDTAPDTIQYDLPTSIPSASGDDLNRAKINGAILDYSPESIDTLVANLDRTSIAGEDPASPNAQSKLRPRPKPPIISSQLKRRKIIKDVKPQPNADELWAAQKEEWQIQKVALKEKFPGGWRPRKRLSPDALDGIRALHSQFPEQYTTEVLAENFEVSPEAIRRILKSKWTPSPEEETSRQERWFNRGKNIWGQMAELGKKPPRRWRREGVVRKPHWNEKKGPRTDYPYMPRRGQPADEGPVESAQRKLSGNLL
ncbi:hypothetical protein HD806DRAFT_296360 [Xylariaceae sp. AK1471]|nr:hypothetical protein HD806DRAFT_296360 [Xylariaceae sp. AK1471]